jgi:hypothetical protein
MAFQVDLITRIKCVNRSKYVMDGGLKSPHSHDVIFVKVSPGETRSLLLSHCWGGLACASLLFPGGNDRAEGTPQ